MAALKAQSPIRTSQGERTLDLNNSENVSPGFTNRDESFPAYAQFNTVSRQSHRSPKLSQRASNNTTYRKRQMINLSEVAKLYVDKGGKTGFEFGLDPQKV